MAAMRRAALKGFNALVSSSTKRFNRNPAVGGFTSATAFSPLQASARFSSVASSCSPSSSLCWREGLERAGSALGRARSSPSTTVAIAKASGVSMAVALVTCAIEPNTRDQTKGVMCAWGWGGGDAENKKDDDEGLDSTMKKLGGAFAGRDEAGDLARSVPTELSFGFVMGVCCGMAVKKTGTFAMVGVGLIFGSIQALSYLGFVTVEYEKIQKSFEEAVELLDFNQNGKVDADDARTLYDKLFKAASFGLPAGSGFTAGAVLGFRRG